MFRFDDDAIVIEMALNNGEFSLLYAGSLKKKVPEKKKIPEIE